MRIEYLVVCDYAADQGGKLTLVGTFDLVNAPTVPYRLPNMGVGIRMRPERADLERGDHKIQVKLVAPDSAVLASLDGELRSSKGVSASDQDPERIVAQLAFNLAGTTFSQYGRHRLELWIDGELKHHVSIFVVKPQSEQVSQ